MKLISALAIVAVALLTSTSSHAETGARLWLRYERIADTTRLDVYRKAVTALMIDSSSPTGRVIGAELGSALAAELGAAVPIVNAVTADGALVVGTPAGGSAIAALGWTAELEQLGAEGYLIRSTRVAGHAATAIASKSEIGALYGVFHLASPDADGRRPSSGSTSPSVPGSSGVCSTTGTTSTAASNEATPANRCGGPMPVTP